MSEQDVRLAQARAACVLGDYASAYRIYDELLTEHPDDVAALLDYGRAKYSQYADLGGATGLFERLLRVDPRSIETLLWLGDLYSLGYGQGYGAAVDLYRSAIRLNRRTVDAYVGLGMLHRAPSQPVTLSEAVASFREATNIEPQRADLHVNLGIALIQAEQLPAGQEELEVAERLLMADGDHRRAGRIHTVITRLQGGGQAHSTAYSNSSPRYRWPKES